MQLVERHVIKRTDPRWKEIDQAAFAAKNMYNAANYLMRQAFIFQGERILGFNALYHQAKHLPVYQELPRKVAQQVLKILQQNWKAFYAVKKDMLFYGRLPRTAAKSSSGGVRAREAGWNSLLA